MNTAMFGLIRNGEVPLHVFIAWTLLPARTHLYSIQVCVVYCVRMWNVYGCI